MIKHFIDISDFNTKELNLIIKTAKRIKENPKKYIKKCNGKTLGMIFEKQSARTRVSFTVGFQKLGGHTIELNNDSIGFGKRESKEDILRTLSQFIDLLMIRNNNHKTIRALSSLNYLPIINGLSDYSHPCQILSDLLTMNEKIGDIKNKTICWIGDYNNVLRSLIHLQNLYLFKLNIVMPKQIIKKSKFKIINRSTKNLLIFNNIAEGVNSANCVMTDTWLSMGEKNKSKIKYFSNYQVNRNVMRHANKEAIFMHCLPANRNKEVSSDLLDSKQSVVWQQAQNRMFVQQAIILNLI